MKLNMLGKTNLLVSEIGFGALTIGPWQLNMSLNDGADIISYAVDNGINFIDTAQYYKTYDYVNLAINRTNKEIIISSKSLETSYEGMKLAVEEARQAMSRDLIDIFLLHEIREGNDWVSRSGAWEYLMEAKSKNLVKAIGISTHHVDVAAEAAQVDEIDIMFPIINYKSLGIRKGTGVGTKEEMFKSILLNKAAGKGVYAMKVFGGGNLSGNYLEALNYVKSLDCFDSMMIGFSSTHELDNIFDYCDNNLPDNFIPDVKSKKIRVDLGDCIGCGNCVERCPNRAITLDMNGQASISEGNCLTCGYCSPICPVFAIVMF
jgi:uncharacterized protein